MKLTLTKVIQVTALLAIGAAGGRVLAAEGDTVMTQVKRQETLDKAKKLLAPREVHALAADPFHPAAFAELVAGMSRVPGVTPPSTGGGDTPRTPAGPRSNHSLLQTIAASLKPSGFFILGGEPTLVFGQKRVKAGGLLTITFEGTEYTLEITAIDRTNFTLRLNREEFTRPNK
jgi:hypothetical protein